VIRTCPPRLKRRDRTPAEEGSFTCRKFTTLDRRLYFPSEGRRAEDFFARKIRRLRPGLNPRARVPEASTLTSRPPKPLRQYLVYARYKINMQSIVSNSDVKIG